MEKFKSKKLIISSYAPPANSGSGLMMWYMLSRFPKDSFAILTSEKIKGDNRYLLDVPYYYYGTPLTSFQFNEKTDTIAQKLRRLAKNFPPTHFVGQIFYAVRLIQRIVAVGSVAIEKEKPSMLVGYSDIGPALIGTYLLSKKYRIPFSLFFYDLYLGNKMPLIFRVLARFYEQRIICGAKHIFVMCDALQEQYQKRYGRADINIIYNSTKTTDTPPKVIRDNRFITYLGSIYWAQVEALKEFIQAIQLITPIVHLRLFTPHSIEYLNEVGIYESDSVSFHTCPPEEVSMELNSSLLNIICLSLESPFPDLINTSSPGRLCEFLKADVPILVHAPEKSFLVKYAIDNNLAFVSSSNNIKTISSIVDEALTSSKRDEKVKNAHTILVQNHDPEKNAKLYWDKINN